MHVFLQDLLAFYRANLMRGPGRRKLASLCAAGKVREESASESKAEETTDVAAAPSQVRLDQATGALASRILQAPSSDEGMSITDRVSAVLEGLGVTAASAGAPPVVDITDASLFKAGMRLYPQGSAVGLLNWRRRQAAPPSKL